MSEKVVPFRVITSATPAPAPKAPGSDLPPWWPLIVRWPPDPDAEVLPPPDFDWENDWRDDLWWRWLIGGEYEP